MSRLVPDGPVDEKKLRRVGLPQVTVKAIVETIHCAKCLASPNEMCRVVYMDRGRVKTKECQPHGWRIDDWLRAGMPKGLQ